MEIFRYSDLDVALCTVGAVELVLFSLSSFSARNERNMCRKKPQLLAVHSLKRYFIRENLIF